MANYKIGQYTIIEEGVEIGDGSEIGSFCVLRSGVTIGRNTKIRDYVELREGTIIGDNCYIDSRVSSSGNCEIESDVVIRYDCILARGVFIGKGTYVSPRVMTNNLNTNQEQIGGAHIGEGCFIGTNAVIQHGLSIGNNVIIGAMSFVNKNCDQDGVYIGIPAKKKL